MDIEEGHVVVVGSSAGGVSALLTIAAALPQFFPAPICVVQHVGTNPSLLPELLRYKGPNHAIHAEDGQRLSSGTIHVAPPGQHMLLEGATVRLTRGPKENHARPAVDPLFRTAACSWGSRAVGVILTGQMDDGAAGLRAIKDCGGVAVVQDPDSAEEPEMPRSAIRHVDVDHVVRLDELPALLTRLVSTAGAPRPARERAQPPAGLAREVAINNGKITFENLSAIAEVSALTCPDCGGGLWEVREGQPLRYRCHTGHAYSALSLMGAQAEHAEQALRNSVRALREREMLLRRFAAFAADAGDTRQQAACTAQADKLRDRVAALFEFAESPLAVDEDVTKA